MANLVLLLLGVDYLRKRARGLYIIGGLLCITGVTLFIDALDNAEGEIDTLRKEVGDEDLTAGARRGRGHGQGGIPKMASTPPNVRRPTLRG